MTEGYQGQPEYVIAGFLTELLEPWVAFEGTEWGEWVGALHEAARSGLSISDEAKVLLLVGWIMEEIDAAIEQDWMEDYEKEIAEAQEHYTETVAYWRTRSESFKGRDALEAKILQLPDWIKPGTEEEKQQRRARELHDRLSDLEAQKAALTAELDAIAAEED